MDPLMMGPAYNGMPSYPGYISLYNPSTMDLTGKVSQELGPTNQSIQNFSRHGKPPRAFSLGSHGKPAAKCPLR